MFFIPFFVLLIILIAIVMLKAVKIVPESQVYIVEKLGKYYQSLSSGLSFINPFFDRVSRVVSLKEQVVDFDPQAVITKDNATIENLTATTLRNIIGDMTVDETLTSRDIINTKMRQELDDATDPWGIKVNRVELKSILPPNDIRVAMEKEMKAEREKRAKILEAQATRESAILVAEGEKQSAILRAEAEKEVKIKEAEGKAQAILEVQKAEAEAIKVLNEAKPTKEILALKSFTTFEKVADGKSTKILIPSEIQNLAGFIQAIKEIK